jgi:hypothetical protein
MARVRKQIYRGGIEPVRGSGGIIEVEQVDLDGTVTVYFCDCGGVKGVDGPFDSMHRNLCQRCGTRNWKKFDRSVTMPIPVLAVAPTPGGGDEQ